MQKRLTHISRWTARLSCLALCCVLLSCKTTKFVPDNEYLLQRANIKVSTKEVDKDNLRQYLRQTQNSEVFGFWKMQLEIYSLQGEDTTKWICRQLRKIGEPPVIYSPAATEASLQQLTKAMQNKGFFNVQVDTLTRITAPKKLSITYNIEANQPYFIRSYRTQLEQTDLDGFANETQRVLIKERERYDAETLDEERTRITSRMRNAGYYFFEKNYLRFKADSAHLQHNIDLVLTTSKELNEASDSIRDIIFRQYKVRNISFFVDTNSQGQPLIREKVLRRQCAIREGDLYSQLRVERTYANLNAMSAVKYVDISFTPISDDELDCRIIVARSKINSVSADIDGTYAAGDWGIGAGVGYVNRNIFKGSEELTLNAKGSYEWRQNGGRAIEAKGDIALRFPNSLKISTSYQFQNRPDEFTRTIATAGMTYSYHKPRSRWYHNFNFVDIGYVYLPWISEEFSNYFLQNNNILKYSYEDHFIMGWSYNATYSSYSQRQPLKNYGTVQLNAETAGNALYGLSTLFNLPQEDGTYKIFSIRYAQYAKADINLTYYQIFNKNHRLVYHIGMGVAVPFGNATSIPFEKRYFAGGSNSVRGWTMRSLGPGTYKGSGKRIDFNNQAGDIKLDLNLEYRVKIFKYLEAAAFTDAGNIWTIQDYETQPGGQFLFSEFYKQLAWSYGVGLRLNFEYFVFRVDMGVKLYDPSRKDDGTAWRTVPNGLRWSDDFAMHFAIGYPF